MKKCYVLLGLLLAVAFLLPQGVFAEDSHYENWTVGDEASRFGANSTENVTIMANTLARIELNETGNVTASGWNLAIENATNEVVGATLKVRSNIVYNIQVEDSMNDNKPDDTDGYMTVWDGDDYVLPKMNLSHPLQINMTVDNFDNVAGGSITIVNDAPATDNDGVTHTVKMRQVVDYGDTVLAGSEMYRIVLKFTAGNL